MGIQKKADGLVALEFSFIFESINAGATGEDYVHVCSAVSIS